MWEISGIGRELRETFSKRQGQLSQLLEAMGMTRESATVQQANTAAASTREARQPPGTGGDLRAAWRAQAPGWGPSPAAGPGGPVPPAPSPPQLATAIFDPGHGVTAHAKTVSRATVLAAVLDALPGGAADLAEAEQLASEVLAQPDGPAVRLPDGASQLTNRQRYTSADVVAAERDVLAAARAGWQAGLAAIPAGAAALAIAATEASAGTSLSGEQRAAVTRLLTEGHGVDAIIGAPGAGKTTLMAAARAGWQAAGLTVAGAATAAVAAQGLHAGSGIPSATIASWLARIQSGPSLAGVDVLVVDEAAMADDRHLARLLAAAAAAGTKVVLTGDPVQLRAIGVGGTFAAVHQQIAGLTLTQNLRQRDPAERQALTLWREGGRDQALRTWAAAGRVHAGEGRADTLAAMAADWAAARAAWAGDPHGELAGVALLAGTNADTGTLNELARAIRRQAGEITGPEVAFRLAGGGTLRLAAGDHVRVRRNDYRSRRAAGDPDLLNGYRGIIREITPGRGAVVEWRRAGPDGPVTELATLSPADIASGIVSYGTAMTVAAAQGATASTALVYGPGLDAHALYVAMSRDRDTARLYLPRELLEDGTDRARHGEPATPAEELQRAIDACARTLAADQPDRLVLTELGGVPSPIAQPPAVIPAESPPPAPPVPAWATRPYGHHSGTALARLDQALRSDLPRLTTRDQRITAAQSAARAGNGPTATALRARRGELTAAAAAAGGLPAARRAAAAAAASSEQARQRHQNAQRHAAHGRAALLLAGLTPRQARDQLAAATRDLLAAQAREHDTRTRAAQLARAAGDAAAAAGLARTWDQQMAAAIAADLRAAAAATPADLASVTFAQHHARTAADARQALDGIAAETSLRAAMPAAQRDQEHTERTAAAARRTAATRDHPASRPEPRGVSRGPRL